MLRFKEMIGGMIALLLLCGAVFVFPQQTAWEQKTDMPKGRKTCAIDAIDSKIYIMCADSKKFMEYDPVSDAYKNLADMPISRASVPDGAAVNGLFYAIGGNSSPGQPGLKTVHAYDPANDTWTKIADMPTGRYMLSVCACEGKIYAGGAYYFPKVFEIYDPATDTWDKRSDDAPPLAGHAMSTFEGKVYCFGGSYGLHTVWEFDPASNTWTRKADMPTGRSNAAAACLDGKIYIFGGTPDVTWPWEPPLDEVEAYDPIEDKWYVGYPNMPTPRFDAGACVVDSHIYVIGGFQGNSGAGAQLVNEVFNPELAHSVEYDNKPDNLSHYWELQFTGITGYPSYPWALNIAAVDENVVWAGADRGVFLRTTDGGQHWNSAVVSGAQSHWFTSIAAINQLTAYYTAGNNAGDTRIYKTTDGGQSWEKQYQLNKSGAYLDYIAFWDENNGIAVGDAVDGSFLILTTSDGGANWSQTPAENIPPPLPNEWAGATNGGGTGLAVYGDKFAWFCTAYGTASKEAVLRAFRTSDRGQTWAAVDLPFAPGANRYVQSVVFQDSLTGYAGMFSDANLKGQYLAKTIDGGTTWNLVPSYVEKGGKINTLCFVPGTDSQMLIASVYDGVVWTMNGGESWHRFPGESGFRGISFVSPTVGWGTVWPGMVGTFVGDLNIPPANPADQVQVEEFSPKSFILCQNYPNPFNPSTTIEYSLPRASFITLTIYDLLGREIRTLVQDHQSAGSHSIVFSANELPSNIYFYKLEGEGFCEIRKMMLVR